jgi:hypothetical protein
MNSNFVIFIVIASILTMAVYSSSTNFVSAETNCYTFGENYVCIFTADSVQPPAKALIWCDKDGKNCTITWASKANVVTPEVKNAVKNAQVQVKSAIKSQKGDLVTGQSDAQNSISSPLVCDLKCMFGDSSTKLPPVMK